MITATDVQGKPRPYGGQAHLYDFEYLNYTDDIPFYLNRLGEHHLRGPLLELGTGTGRVAIPLAEAGFQVVGIDLSVPMLRRARRRRHVLPAEVARRLRFARMDMTSFSFRERFDAVLIPFSALAMLQEPEQRRACLERSAAHLPSGGLLWIDLFAPSLLEPPAGGAPVHYQSTFRIPPYGHTIEKTVEERYDPVRRVKNVRYHFRKKPYLGERILSEFTVEFALARIGEEELEQAVSAAGFDLEAKFGDYRDHPYGPKSGRMIFECRRR